MRHAETLLNAGSDSVGLGGSSGLRGCGDHSLSSKTWLKWLQGVEAEQPAEGQALMRVLGRVVTKTKTVSVLRGLRV